MNSQTTPQTGSSKKTDTTELQNWEFAESLPLDPLTKQVGGSHYKKYKIQPIEYAMANSLNYCQANAIKYITRYRDKGGIEDLHKAIHNLEILIELESNSGGEF